MAAVRAAVILAGIAVGAMLTTVVLLVIGAVAVAAVQVNFFCEDDYEGTGCFGDAGSGE